MMQSAEALLFQAALGVQDPWIISEIRLNEVDHEFHITLDFTKGATFPCPECAQACKAYDSADRTWHHLNFFQFKTYLHARLLRLVQVQALHYSLKVWIRYARSNPNIGRISRVVAIYS
jgi:transposase